MTKHLQSGKMFLHFHGSKIGNGSVPSITRSKSLAMGLLVKPDYLLLYMADWLI